MDFRKGSNELCSKPGWICKQSREAEAAPTFGAPEQEQLLAAITEMLKEVAINVGAQLV